MQLAFSAVEFSVILWVDQAVVRDSARAHRWPCLSQQGVFLPARLAAPVSPGARPATVQTKPFHFILIFRSTP